MSQLKALIFDVDGTLADTERQGHRVAFNRAFADAGLDWVWSEALYGELLEISGGKERIRHYIEHHQPTLPPDADSDTSNFIEHLQNAKTRHYVELVQRGEIPARPGVLRLLTEARQAGLRLAIATTSTLVNVTSLLAVSFGSDINGWFEVIGAGDIVPAKKPAADIYCYVLEKLGLKAGECLVFEDTENGLLAARGADIPVVVTVNDYTLGQNFTGAALVVNQLGEPDAPLTCLAGQLPVNTRLLDVTALKLLHANLSNI